jgi:hypothetical protein
MSLLITDEGCKRTCTGPLHHGVLTQILAQQPLNVKDSGHLAGPSITSRAPGLWKRWAVRDYYATDDEPVGAMLYRPVQQWCDCPYSSVRTFATRVAVGLVSPSGARRSLQRIPTLLLGTFEPVLSRARCPDR